MIKRNDNKLYVKWKDCDGSFDSWIDKKTKYKCANISQSRSIKEDKKKSNCICLIM